MMVLWFFEMNNEKYYSKLVFRLQKESFLFQVLLYVGSVVFARTSAHLKKTQRENYCRIEAK